MGRRLKVRWDERDTPEYLKATYRDEQDGAVRVRLEAMRLLRRGKSVSLVADVLDVNYRTVQKWPGWYRSGGLEGVKAHRRGGIGKKPYLSDDAMLDVAIELVEGRF